MENSEPSSNVIDYGYEAVNKPAKEALGYGDEAVEAQGGKTQKKQPPKREPQKNDDKPKTIVIVCGGFPAYSNPSDEIKAAGKWHPNTIDYLQTAKDTVGEKGVILQASDVNSFFKHLQGSGKISRVIILSHGSERELYLSGDTRQGKFIKGNRLTVDSLRKLSSTEIKKIKDELSQAATIDLMICNGALEDTFIQTMANTFGVKVRGYGASLLLCYDWNAKKDKIVSRGRIAFESEFMNKGKPPCSNDKVWHTGIDSLIDAFPPKEFDPIE